MADTALGEEQQRLYEIFYITASPQNPPKIDLTDGDTTISVQAVDVSDREPVISRSMDSNLIEHMKINYPKSRVIWSTTPPRVGRSRKTS